MGGYCIQDIVSWYQKKIGTYDKQQWEKTVEQRILNGFTHVPKKTAKLKTELIDVDLVRGSSFTKAKPKDGLVTLCRLALLRLVLLPFYARWWSQQSSPKLFALLLTLYVFQIVNMCLYSYCAHHLPEDAIENVSASEVIVPAAMMFFLCILHSEIVSPHCGQKDTTKYANKSVVKRSKRIKRRIRNVQSFDFKSSPDTGSEYKTGSVTDGCAKFAKRLHHRGRKLSFEDGMIKGGCTNASCRQRRSVMWDTSPVKTRIVAHHRVPVTEHQPVTVSNTGRGGEEEVRIPPGAVGILDDDGFESLNSNGSSDQSEVTPLAEEEQGDQSTNARAQDAPTESNSSTWRDNVVPDKKRVFYSCKRIPLISDKLKNLRSGGINNQLSSGETDHNDSDTDNSDKIIVTPLSQGQRLLNRRRGSQQTLSVNICGCSGVGCCCGGCSPGQDRGAGGDNESSSDYEEDDDEEVGGGGGSGTGTGPGAGATSTNETCGTSTAECIGVTTNSDDCSVTSDIDHIPVPHIHDLNDHPFASEFQLLSPTVILSPSCAASDKVSCTMWEKREVKKAELSVLDISSAIIARVEAMPENLDYFYGGMLVSLLLGMVPSLYRLTEATSLPSVAQVNNTARINSSLPALDHWLLYAPYTVASFRNLLSVYSLALSFVSSYAASFLDCAFGTNVWERCIAVIALVERTVLSALFFFLIAIAERTFKQRFLYAKFFSHLTSFRRARKSELPHFRLNKVRNIKTWLSVRSYLKKRGPQHSVDVIVSSVFLITLLLLSFLSVELLKDSERLHSMYNIEALVWCIILGLFLLRFMTLGTKINRKYRNLSVLITEQINLYLQIEQKPNKKEELMVANSVLKLAADLLKELECPYKISGLSANPYLYTITKVVILSALSGVLSEMLGFKLKLHKIKIK